MKDVVIVSACRTAIGSFGGSLKDSTNLQIASTAMREAVKRAGIDAGNIDDVRFGCCLEHEDGMNCARVSALLAGIPDTTPAVTINRVCTSAMEAMASGMAMIKSDFANIILAGGVEHMSGVSYTVQNARWGCRLQDNVFVDRMIRGLHCGSHILRDAAGGPVDNQDELINYFKGKPYIMGHTAEFYRQSYEHQSRRNG